MIFSASMKAIEDFGIDLDAAYEDLAPISQLKDKGPNDAKVEIGN